jgi:hypothetical protein
VVKIGSPTQLAALGRVEQQVTAIRQHIADAVARIPYDDSADTREPEKLERAEYVWIEDGLPAGARSSADAPPNGTWKFVTAPDHPVYSGSKSSVRTATGLAQHYFEAANPGLTVGAGDVLFAHVYLDPKQPPREVMRQWNSGQWLHRAYWGENLIDWGKDGTTERLQAGPLPETGKWVRLEVEAAKVGLKPGMVINGWAFTQFDGTVYWDRAGIVTRTPQGKQVFETFAGWLKVQQASGGEKLPRPLQTILKIERPRRTEAQQ